MPDKHPNTVRWGGPGASHEDRTKPMPRPSPGQPEGAASTNPRVSQESGGGGERDEKHSHVDALRSSKSHTTGTPSPTSTEDWRRNRSRHDRMAQMASEETIGEPRSFREGAPQGADSPDAPDAGHGTPVQVHYEGDMDAAAGITAEAKQRVRRAMARFDRELSDVQVYLTDESRMGSPGLRTCTIQATPHRGEMVAVTESARDMDKAVLAAGRELVRRLSEAFGRPSGDPDASGEAAPQG